MDIKKIIILIDEVLMEADNYILTHNSGKTSIDDTKNVTSLLKKEILTHPEHINERILRAMHDVGMSAYKEFENTTLEKAIENLTSFLYFEIPIYSTLKPLRKDFGKQHPI